MQYYIPNVNLNWNYVLLSFTTTFGKLLFSYPIANCIDPGGFVTFQTLSNLLHFFVSTTLSDNIWFNFHITKETDFTTLHCSALHCTVMFLTALYCIALYVLYCTSLLCTTMQFTSLHFTALHCTAL